MKKFVKSFVILAVVALALGSATAVFAQGSTPGAPVGFGSRGSRGGMGSGSALLNQNRDNFQDGVLHDEMIAAFAEALGLDADVVETRLADGETLAEIAGLPIDEFRALMVEIQTLVHEWAVEEGILPESMGPRGGMGRFGGMQGGGQGLYGSGDCLVD